MTATSCVLFDLDGTLLDSTALIISSYRHTLEQFGAPPPSEHDIISGFGTPLRANLERLSPNRAWVEEMMLVYSEHNGAHHDAMVSAFPGAVDTVRAIAERVPVAIVTGKRRHYALLGIAFLGLTDVFETVVTPERTERGKPSPDPVLAALADLRLDAAGAWFVGDSPHDMAAGRAAGVRTVAAEWGPFPSSTLSRERPTYRAESISELPELLGLT